MKKDNFSVLVRSSLALFVSATFLTPAQLLASGSFEDEGAALVATPAKAKDALPDDTLRSLTNISSQLQEHAERAETRVQKVIHLVAQAAQDIAEDENSIDFKALVKTAMPKGTEDALGKIYDAHERIALAYNLMTPTAELQSQVKQLEPRVNQLAQELDDARKEVAEVKAQAGISSDEAKNLEEQYKLQIQAITEEKDKQVAEKQRELDETNAQKEQIQAHLQTVVAEKERAVQDEATLIQGVKALYGQFDGKDIGAMDESSAKEMLRVIQTKLAELATAK